MLICIFLMILVGELIPLKLPTPGTVKPTSVKSNADASEAYWNETFDRG